ncbi:MAG TPA: 2-isopropylmalate synthase, partial [Parvularcula sp.]|nr:2-isopropylmalate synthase [Parvularcula sp.]
PAKRKRIHTFLGTSPTHRDAKLKMKKAEIIARISEVVSFARACVDDVEFSPEDAIRTEHDFLQEAVAAAIEAGATTINIPDTVGYATPGEITSLFRMLTAKAPPHIVFSAHCHDDLGMAVANSLSAVRAGARQVECTINGIGERAGNCSLEEVVMALKTRETFFNARTGIQTNRLYPTARLVSSITGMPIPRNKAIVGDNAFAHEAGIHQHGVLQAAITYEIMTPQSIGRPSNELVLGKHSGRHALRERLKELGYELEGEELARAFKRFKDLADRKKAIYNEDLEAIVADSVVTEEGRFVLGDLHVQSGTFATPQATVQLLVSGEAKKATAQGDGPVDAVFKAIVELTESKGELLQYQVKAITGGMDAQGEVTVSLGEGGRRVIGHGAHTDIIVASARAYVQAVNKLEWHTKRRETDAPRGI